MGNRNSAPVTRLEYSIHMQKIEKELSKMHKNFNESFTEIVRKQKNLAEEIDKVQRLINEKEQIFDIVEENLARVHSVSKSVEMEARKTKEEIGQKMKEAISKEKLKIEADIDEIKMRNTYLKDNVMELTTLDLSHERQLRELMKRVEQLESNERSKTSIQTMNSLSKKKMSQVSENNDLQNEKSSSDDMNVNQNGNQRDVRRRKKSSFGSNFDKIDAAIRKLKEDIKAAEMKN